MPEEEHRRLGIWEIGQGLEAWLGGSTRVENVWRLQYASSPMAAPKKEKLPVVLTPIPVG